MRNSRLVPPDAGADLAAATITAFFREHHGELVRLALLMVGDLASAEDVVQDVYASLHTRWGTVAAAESPLPYVRAAVLNGCRTVLGRGPVRSGQHATVTGQNSPSRTSRPPMGLC